MKVNNSTHSAIKWSTLGHVLPQVITPMLTIYIARMLSPEAYGVIAITTIIISFLTLFLAGGFTTALIQKKGTPSEIYNSANFVFSFNLIISIFFFILIVLFSSNIADFFHAPEARIVICVLSLDIVIRAFGDVQLAMLQKGMDFKSIFFRQLIPIFSQALITLPLAFLGFEVWALVAGVLGSQFLASLILWMKSDWKPKINFNYKENRDLLRFGIFVIGESFLAWIINQGDNLIVGRYLSVGDLGLYRTGFDLDNRIFSLLLVPLVPVLYSKLCSINLDNDKNSFYIKTKGFLGMIVFPSMAGIILISGYFDNLILGEKWNGIGFIMAMLAINPGISYLWTFFPSFLKSKGKPQIATLLTLISAITFLPVYLIFVRYGLTTFIIARVSLGIVGIVFFTFFESKELKISLLTSLKLYYKPFVSALTMLIIGYFIQEYFLKTYTWINLILLILFSVAIYLIVTYLTSKNELFKLKDIIFRKTDL